MNNCFKLSSTQSRNDIHQPSLPLVLCWRS